MYTSIANIISNMVDDLKTKLGDRYQVAPYYLSGSMTQLNLPSTQDNPDILILDTETNKLTVVEVKGSQPFYDLPLGTVSMIEGLKESLSKYNPEVVLVSGSYVNPQLEHLLEMAKVDVILFKDSEQASSELMTIIQKQDS